MLSNIWLFCNLVDCSLPGSSVHEISQTGIPECVEIFLSRGSPQPRDRTCISFLTGGFFTIESPGKPPRVTCFTEIMFLVLTFLILYHHFCQTQFSGNLYPGRRCSDLLSYRQTFPVPSTQTYFCWPLLFIILFFKRGLSLTVRCRYSFPTSCWSTSFFL